MKFVLDISQKVKKATDGPSGSSFALAHFGSLGPLATYFGPMTESDLKKSHL